MRNKRKETGIEIRVLRQEDPDYPPLLRAYRSHRTCTLSAISTLKQRTLAVVGSRKCSETCKRVAMQIGKAAAQNPVTLVSGMAKGIDSFAHLGALRAGTDHRGARLRG